jgi:RHS repeat-associated protein
LAEISKLEKSVKKIILSLAAALFCSTSYAQYAPVTPQVLPQGVDTLDGSNFVKVSPNNGVNDRPLSSATLEKSAPAGAYESTSNTLYDEYDKSVKLSKTISALGVDLFGETVDMKSGQLGFSVTDVSLPGNNALPVAFGRKYSVRDVKGYLIDDGAFGDWNLDIPSLSTTSIGGWRDQRCTAPTSASTQQHINSLVPPTLSISKTDYTPNSPTYGLTTKHFVYPRQYWNGFHADMPNGGEMLLPGANSKLPSSGGPYFWVTNQRTSFSCLPTVKNATGEGFVAITPDGTKYFFDWMALNWEPRINVGFGYYYERYRSSLYVTRVEDRFGNWVNYTYANAANLPIKLTQITSSDGRQLNVSYTPNPYRDYVSSVTDGTRTWRYEYDRFTTNIPSLRKVILPDNSYWETKFSSSGITGLSDARVDYWYYTDPQRISHTCSDPGTVVARSFLGTIKHPNGAIGEFVIKPTRIGRSNVKKDCQYNTTFSPRAPRYALENFEQNTQAVQYDALSLNKKTVSGPGTPSVVSTYEYTSNKIGFDTTGMGCISETCAGKNFTKVTHSDGSFQKFTFGNSYAYNEGKLLLVENGSGVSVLQTEANTYKLPVSGQPYHVPVGYSPQRGQTLAYDSEYLIPQKSSTTTVSGVNFNSVVNSFDAYERPLSVTKSSSTGNTKTDVIAYLDDLNKFVLGLVTSVTNSDTGKIQSQTDYDANSLLPIRSYNFGLLSETNVYNSNGTLATTIDPKGAATNFSNYKRGIPQTVSFPDGSSITAAVNDLGWITSTTDQLASVTSYEYDSMGRISKINYPTGDTNAWAPTNYMFSENKTTENLYMPGASYGQWRQSVWDDRKAQVTYFDAYLRPILEQEWDWADGATIRHVFRRYDLQGREVFKSYPTGSFTDPNTLLGTHTEYDALGRVTKVKQDSELGVLTTSTDYLNGFQTKTTNPKGVVTRQGYQVFDAPDTSRPVFTVYAEGTPESKVHDVARDVFGNVFAHAMRDAAHTYTKHHWYVRDANMRVCKTTTPEGGATHYEYDANGNVIRMADGDQTYTNTSTCDAHNIALSEKTVTTYDVMNRVTSIDVPGGANGDKAYGYEADGLVSYINNTSNNQATVNRYAYNKRRLLTGESSEQTGWYVWGMGYAYNNNAALSRITYPTSFYVDYAPNGLGQATQAASIHGTWANNVQYYPNGAVKQFTYGNGIVHTMYQNARQLPAATVAKLGNQSIQENHHVFDANGNVSYIGDPANGERNARAMQYDALDRLTQVHSPNNFGVANYQYDALDNLKRSTLGAAGFTYHYDTNNRIQRVDRDGGGSYNYTHDARGNIVNDGRHPQFTYDRANRLFDVSGVEGYRYDGNNRRVLAWSPASGSIISVYGQNGQLFYQQNERENQNYEYIYLGDDLVATRNCCIGNVIKTRYQHTDALGSPVATTNEAGAVVDRTEYAPYGAPLNRPVSGVGYTGHVMDSTTGLVYAQQRYYDPMIGRFLSTDPVASDPNNGGNFNRYWYGNNNPYKYTDPDGMLACWQVHGRGSQTCIDYANRQFAEDSRALVSMFGGPLGTAQDAYIEFTENTQAAIQTRIKNVIQNAVINKATGGLANPVRKMSSQIRKANKGNVADELKKVKMLGEKGTKTASSTVWKGNGKARIDVENPNPGQRPGQIHYQDNNGNKYLYDPGSDSFPGAPKAVNSLLQDKSFRSGIEKGLKQYLGE